MQFANFVNGEMMETYRHCRLFLTAVERISKKMKTRIFSDSSTNHVRGIGTTAILFDEPSGYRLHIMLIDENDNVSDDMLMSATTRAMKMNSHGLASTIKHVTYEIMDGVKARSTVAERLVFDYVSDDVSIVVTDSMGVVATAKKSYPNVTVIHCPGHGTETPCYLKYVDIVSRAITRRLCR